MIGDGGTGKTSIRNQVIHGRFNSAYRATIGADFWTKEVGIFRALGLWSLFDSPEHTDFSPNSKPKVYIAEEDRTVSIQIWDTAGQERFRALGAAFYRGADACVLVFDVTELASFEHIPSWLQDFVQKGGVADPSRYPFVLLGNKIDKENERVVTKQMGREMAGWLRDLCADEKTKIPVSARTDSASSLRSPTEAAEPTSPTSAVGRRRSGSTSLSRKKSRSSESLDSQRSFAIAADTVSSAVQSVSTWLRGTAGPPSNPKPISTTNISGGSSGLPSPTSRSETSFSEGSFRTAGSGSPSEGDNLLESSRSRTRSVITSDRSDVSSNLSPGWVRDPSPAFQQHRHGSSVGSADGLLVPEATDRISVESGARNRRSSFASGSSPLLSSLSLDERPLLDDRDKETDKEKEKERERVPQSASDGPRPFRPEIAYFESSALSGAHVEDAFAYIARVVKLPVFAFEVTDEERIDLRQGSGSGSSRKGRRRSSRSQPACSC